MANLSFSSISTSFKSLSLSSSPFLSGSQKHVAPSSISLPSNSSRKLGSLTVRMAHKKGAGSSRNGRDSKPKMLGVKIYGDQLAKPGAIIIRQRGTKFYPGENVGMGKDHTIFSLIDGLVKFEKYGVDRKKISVYPHEIKPENPNSYRVKRREFFRKQRVRRAAKKGGFVKTKVVLPSNADVAEPVLVDS